MKSIRTMTKIGYGHIFRCPLPGPHVWSWVGDVDVTNSSFCISPSQRLVFPRCDSQLRRRSMRHSRCELSELSRCYWRRRRRRRHRPSCHSHHLPVSAFIAIHERHIIMQPFAKVRFVGLFHIDRPPTWLNCVTTTLYILIKDKWQRAKLSH